MMIRAEIILDLTDIEVIIDTPKLHRTCDSLNSVQQLESSALQHWC